MGVTAAGLTGMMFDSIWLNYDSMPATKTLGTVGGLIGSTMGGPIGVATFSGTTLVYLCIANRANNKDKPNHDYGE